MTKAATTIAVTTALSTFVIFHTIQERIVVVTTTTIAVTQVKGDGLAIGFQLGV